MESFNLPVSAIVSIVVCCSAIAVTFVNPSFNQEPTVVNSVSRKAYYSTGAERLLVRFLNDERAGYERLLGEMKSLYGDRAGEELLKAVTDAIPLETDNELRGKLYAFKGMSLINSGLREEAIDSLKMALNLDPFNKTAAETLNTIYGVGGGKSSEETTGTVVTDK